MAVRGNKAKFFISEIPLSLSVSQINGQNSVNVIAYNVLQTDGTLKIPSINMQNIAINGYMQSSSADDIRGRAQAALSDTDESITILLGTDQTPTVGQSFSSSFASEFSIETPIDNLLTINAKFENVTDGIYGYCLANEETVSATGITDTAYVDFGAQGTTGGDVILIVSDITGTATDATVTIESDDNTGFTSAATEATLQFSAVGVITGSLSGTVDRYIRINVTDLGGATDFAITVIVGINGITQ